MNFKWLRAASVSTPLLIVVLGVVLYFLLRKPAPDEPLSPDVIPFVSLTGIALFSSLITLLFLVVFDIIQVIKRRSFSLGAKAGWICAILFLSIFAVPVYGLLYFKEHR
jgi:hypothetical protein